MAKKQIKEFSFKTMEKFDTHILKSIRGFSDLEEIFLQAISSAIPKQKASILDIGCSTGRFLKKVQDQYKDINCVGIDIEPEMIKNKVFKGDLIIDDIVNYDIEAKFDVIISMFTIQFLHSKYQNKVLKKIFDALNSGGMFLISEKTYYKYGKDQSIINSLYYEYKYQFFNGDEILTKEIDLRRIMHPKTEDDLVDLLSETGFKVIRVWRNYQFIGLVCIKE